MRGISICMKCVYRVVHRAMGLEYLVNYFVDYIGTRYEVLNTCGSLTQRVSKVVEGPDVRRDKTS